MIKIKRDSLSYRIAHPHVWDLPGFGAIDVSLGEFIGAVLTGIICLIVRNIVGITTYTIYALTGSVIGLFFSKRVVGYKTWVSCCIYSEEIFVDIKRWQEAFGHRVWPVTLFLVFSPLYYLTLHVVMGASSEIQMIFWLAVIIYSLVFISVISCRIFIVLETKCSQQVYFE